MKRKVTGVVIALTMCLNAMPTTVMAENESPQGGDIKTVSESGGQSEETGAEETTPTKKVDNSKGEKGETKAEKGEQKEKEPTEEENKAEEKKDESKDSKAPSAEENKQQEEETKAEKGEQEEKEPTEGENKAEEKKDESKDSKAPSAEENKQQEEETKAEKTTNEVKQPAAETQATPLTVQEGIAVQSELDESNAAAKVETTDGTTIYYSNIKDAFENTLPGGSVVTALKSDDTYPIDINFNTTGEGVTFDLNGCILYGIVGNIQSGAILKVVNDKYSDPPANTGLIHVNSGGTLIFSPKDSNTCMQLYNNGGNITLSGGCFYICNGSQNKPISEYLKEGYAYKKTNGTLMEYAEARKTTTYSSDDLYAVECNHIDTVRDNDTGRYYCKYCNMKIPFTMTQEPNQDQLNSIVYHGDNNGAMIPFVFSRHDSIESNVKVRYSIDKGTEIEKTLSNNTLNLIDELNQFPAGTHTLTLSAEYGGYTMPSRTYTFTVLQSGSEINVTNYTESAKYSDTGFISIYGKVTPTGTAVSTNTNSISTYSNDSTLGSVEIYCDNKKVGTGTLNKETNYVSFTAFVMLSNIGAGKKTLTIKYIGNGSMADAETSIDVTVEKLTPTISWDGYPDGKSYTGSAIADPQSSDITVGNGGSFKDITFDWYKANKNGDNYTKVGEKLSSNPVNAGDYIVEAVFKETDKTNAVTISKGITINKKDSVTNNNEPITESVDVYVTSFEQTYKVDLKNVLEKNNISGITENDVFTANTEYGFVNLEGQVISAAIVADENKLEIVMDYLSTGSHKTVGTVEICFSSTNYNSIKMKFVLHSVNKPERNLDVTMDNWTYGDTAKTPVYTLPEENPKLKTVSYAKKNGTVLNAVPTDAGEYKVTVKAEYDDYVYTGSADFTIIPKDISNDDVNVEVTLDHNTFEYDGTQKEVNVVSVVVDGEPLELGKDYGISSISGADADTYVIKIIGNGYDHFTKKYVGNYVGQYTVNWTITPKPVTPSVEVTGTYTYTGNEIKPTIVVKDGETVIPESEYEVSCRDNTNAGTGRIIITDKDGGNYIVNGEKEFTIEKAEVTIKALDKDRRRGRGMLDIPATLTEGEDCTVTGLKGDDKLGGTISISFAETEDSSKYDINITADGINENYTPVYEKGTLNIYKKGTDESDPSYTGGSSSGGGSSSSSSKNDVTVDSKTENGKITIDKNSASKGSTVTITVTPDEGYEIDEIKVTDESGNEIKVTDKGNGKYTFTMPATDADIKADFKAISDEEEKTVITMQIGNTDVTVNEDVIKNDVAPVIVNDRTLVPIRIATETLGGKVDWNDATKEVTLNIDGKEIKMTIGVILEKYGVAPMIINDRTYVPIRFVAEELGAEVQWNEETKTVTIIKQ